jgi:hypothetical protein
MIEESSTLVSLDSYLHESLPLVLEPIDDTKVARLRGIVESHSPNSYDFGGHKKYTLRLFADIQKPVAYQERIPVPPIEEIIELIATEGLVWYFAKWWTPIPRINYRLRSDTKLEDLALEILAGKADHRITADDLHTEEILEVLEQKKRDRRALGSVLLGLAKHGTLKVVGTVKSRRPECHYRPKLNVYTWGQSGPRMRSGV